jgi:hypothetical protein
MLRFLPYALLLAFGMGFVAPSPAAAAHRLAVVPLVAPGAAPIDALVAARLLGPLRQSGIEVIGGAAYVAAARRVNGGRDQLLDPESVILVARQARVERVLFVRSSADRDLRSTRSLPRHVYAVRLILLNGDTGEELFNRRYPRPKKALPARLGQQMLADLQPALRPLLPPARRRRTEPAAPPLEPLPPAYRPEATYGQAELDPRQANVPFGGRGIPEAALPRLAAPVEMAPPPAEVDLRSARTPLRIGLSPTAYTRTGELLTRSDLSPPRYGPRRGVGAPAFFRIRLSGEIYPFGFVPADAWTEGLGAHFELNLGAVRTRIGAASLITHAVGGGSGGLQYRWVWWHSKRSPDLLLKAGGARFSFPLNEAEFPGVGYTSPYVGGGITVPVLDLLELFAEATYQPRLGAFGGTRTLGPQIDWGWGFAASGGFRVTVLEHLQVGATFEMTRYTVPFYGLTRLPTENGLQYGNVRLQDTYYACLFGAGFVM